jgi:HPt (histidine-containing phosphotransfer) domain-containing protein
MLDLEQSLKELHSFVKRITDDKKENIQEILTRQKEICEEIHKIRKSLKQKIITFGTPTHCFNW